MQQITRAIGLGYLALALLVTALKALLPLGPLGYAPLALPLGPGSRPVEVVIWYSSDKQAWIEEAARRFAAAGGSLGGRPIALRLVGLGSGEIAARVASQDWRGDGVPAAISPASSLWLEQIGVTAEGAPQPLVLSPLVALAWEDRAQVLWPDGGADFWGGLNSALNDPDGWPGVAAARGFAPDSPEAQRAAGWGFVKLGHSSPLSSNSGAQTLILLAYAHHNKTRGLSTQDLLDPSLRQFLTTAESAALASPPASSAGLVTSLIQFGPSRYDVTMLPESLAIERIQAAESRWGAARIYYPPATMFSDHPFVTLDGELASAEQRAAAGLFYDFLRSRPMQQLALSYGFRPTDPGVSIASDDADNPFNRLAGYGVRADIAAEVEPPSAEVLRGLLELWRSQIQPLTVAPQR